MKELGVLAIMAAALAAVPLGGARSDAYSARVSAPPEIQYLGRSYFVRIRVTNTGRPVKRFCIDFGDDHNSWLIRMPGLRAYDKDVFCWGTLRHGRKTFTARIIPAKAGNKKLSILVGSATIYRAINDAVITDKNALEWSDRFVLVG